MHAHFGYALQELHFGTATICVGNHTLGLRGAKTADGWLADAELASKSATKTATSSSSESTIRERSESGSLFGRQERAVCAALLRPYVERISPKLAQECRSAWPITNSLFVSGLVRCCLEVVQLHTHFIGLIEVLYGIVYIILYV